MWHCCCTEDQLEKLRELKVPVEQAGAVHGECRCSDRSLLDCLGMDQTPRDDEPATTRAHVFMSSLDVRKFISSATSACNCGSGQKPCSAPQHLAAVDGVAAALHARGDHAAAFQYALRMIQTDYRQPEVRQPLPCRLPSAAAAPQLPRIAVLT